MCTVVAGIVLFALECCGKCGDAKDRVGILLIMGDKL